MFLDDTIAAIATPLGEGGLAVIRLSGPKALAVADKCFVPLGKSSVKLSVAFAYFGASNRPLDGTRSAEFGSVALPVAG